MFFYRKATIEDLENIWDRSIAENPNDPRYLRWKTDFISRNLENRAATFVIVKDQEPIGEVTLAYDQSGSRAFLADGKTAGYVQALRIRKAFEGQGHTSRLMKVMEAYASHRGITQLTIGVEALESRTVSIYNHWGYNRLIMEEIDDGIPVLFFAKDLAGDLQS